MSDPSVATAVSPEGIWAEVTIDIQIEPYAEKTDRVTATVTINAINKTTSSITLREPYRLPARRVQNVSARLPDGAQLPATATREQISVYFEDRKILAGGTFSWTIAYVRMAELYLDRILAYDLFIDPQRKFQGVEVKNHHFNLRVSIVTPDDAKWRPLRHWQLYQRNYPLSMNPQIKQSEECAICDFGHFDLVDQPFDLRIAAVYSFKNLIAHAFQLAVAAAIVVLIEHGLAALVLRFLAPG